MTKKAKVSIASIDPEAKANTGHEFEIIDTDSGEGTGMFLTVVGKESSTYKREIRNRINAQRRQEFSGKGKLRTIEDDIAESIAILAACTTGWRNIVIEEAEGVLPFTPENVSRLYAYDFVRLQADEQVMRLGNSTPS